MRTHTWNTLLLLSAIGLMVAACRRDPAEVVARAPELIIGSWCGKHFRPERMTSRPGWLQIPAVQHGMIGEIKSALILSPGISAISEGLPAIAAMLDRLESREKR